MNLVTRVERNENNKPLSCDVTYNGVTITFAIVKNGEIRDIGRSCSSNILYDYDQFRVSKIVYYKMLKQAMGILKGKVKYNETTQTITK